MLWYKAWLDTRWRFLTGLALLVMLAAGTVYGYRFVEELLPLSRQVEAAAATSPLIRRALEIQREYRGYVWWQAFRQNLPYRFSTAALLLWSVLALTGAAAASAAAARRASRMTVREALTTI